MTVLSGNELPSRCDQSCPDITGNELRLMLLYASSFVKYDIIETKGCRDETVPVKIRKLKADLRKAGFLYEPGKDSHTRWYYPHDRTIKVILSGNDGDDADKYQIKQVYNALKRVKEL